MVDIANLMAGPMAMMNLTGQLVATIHKRPASMRREKSKKEICREIADAFARAAEAYEHYDRDKKTLLDKAVTIENPDQYITNRIETRDSVVEEALSGICGKIKWLYQAVGLVDDDE